MKGIHNTGPDHHAFEANAHHVGAQRDTIVGKDLAKKSSARTTHTDGHDVERSEDGVKLGEHAGTHTGSTQELSGEARRLAAARARLQEATEVGGRAPGETDDQAKKADDPAKTADDQSKKVDDPTRKDNPTPGQPSGAAQALAAQQAAQQEQDNIYKILNEMAAERQKWWADIQKIWMDTQTYMLKTFQDAYAYRQQVMDAAMAAWNKVLRGSG